MIGGDDMEIAQRKELDGVVRLGGNELTGFIADNDIKITPEQLAEIARYVNIGGYPGKLFRHNGKVVQYLTSSFRAIPFPTMVREDTEYSYDSKSRGITIGRDGWYSIRAAVSVGITSNTRQTSEYAVFLNGKIQEGSRSYGYHRLSKAGNMTTTLQYLLDVTKGDVVDIRCREFSSRDQRTIANSCNIMIERA